MTFAASVITLIAGYVPVASSGHADGLFEPEAGLYAGLEHDPYDLALRRLLVGSDRPQCGIVVVPSRGPEWFVGLVVDSTGVASAVSREFSRNLHRRMMEVLVSFGSDGAISMDDAAQLRALGRLSEPPAERRAELEDVLFKRLSGLCENVLLKTSHHTEHRLGLDGTLYHAVHWMPGRPLTGVVWSPTAGSAAALVVELHTALAHYAKSSHGDRALAKGRLSAAADRLEERLDGPKK